MTMPEQSDRAVHQAREFLVRLASPYVASGINGIRREVLAESLRLLRHYPYVRTDEKRGVGDMSGAAPQVPRKYPASTPQGESMSDIVTRLRDWRNVHLARLHLLMEEAADKIAILESKLSLREDLEQGLMDGVARLQAEVERLQNGALTTCETVSQDGDFPESDNAANRDILTTEEREAVETAMNAYGSDNANPECAAIEATLWGLLERTK